MINPFELLYIGVFLSFFVWVAQVTLEGFEGKAD